MKSKRTNRNSQCDQCTHTHIHCQSYIHYSNVSVWIYIPASIKAHNDPSHISPVRRYAIWYLLVIIIIIQRPMLCSSLLNGMPSFQRPISIYDIERHLQNHMRIVYTHIHRKWCTLIWDMCSFTITSRLHMYIWAFVLAWVWVRVRVRVCVWFSRRLWSFANEHPFWVIRIVLCHFHLKTANERKENILIRSHKRIILFTCE